MLKRLFLFLIILSAHTTGNGQTPWSSFKWGHDSVTVNGQRAFVPRSAIFIPVSFTGDPRRYYLQLDLSSDVPILLYATPNNINTKLIDNKPFYNNSLNKCFRIDTVLKGSLGNATFSLDSAHYCLMRNKDDTSKNYTATITTAIIGTIGLNYFLNKVLVIDYPHQQFMILDDTAAVPKRLKRSIYYVPSRVVNSKLLIPVSYGDTIFKDFFYETGSGIFDMMMSKTTWHKLTDRNGSEKDNYDVKVNAWGKKIEAIGARSKLPVRVGIMPLNIAMPFYLSADESFKDTYGCDGMIGNSLFLGKVLVIDFVKNRFGVFNPM